MAEITVDEGLDHIHGVWPKNGTNDPILYEGMFVSQSPTTVPARTATGGAAPAGWTEMTGSGYARIAIAAGSWGAPTTDGLGRKITAAPVSFVHAGGAPWPAANGSFIATKASSQAGDIIICFANFDSGVSRTLQAIGDHVDVTPSWRLDQ